MDLQFLIGIKKGDPFLSAGLVKIGDPIYLAKWETNDSRPSLLHIQSIGDVELFGIYSNNYTKFVLDREPWQQRFSFNTDALERAELAAVAPPGARIPPPAPTSPPPTRVPPTSIPPTAVPATPVPAPVGYPLADPPPDDTRFYCLRNNPSCARDPWWVEWNEVQESDLWAYRPAPGLVFEFRFVEALRLIWQWPQGKDLIRDASTNGVTIIAAPATLLPESFASYNLRSDILYVSRDFTETSTWMVADVLAHELKHASDDLNGFTRDNAAECVLLEQRAYVVESQFLRWISTRMGGLPNAGQVASRLSLQDFELFLNIQALVTAPNPATLAATDYRQSCSATFR